MDGQPDAMNPNLPAADLGSLIKRLYDEAQDDPSDYRWQAAEAFERALGHAHSGTASGHPVLPAFPARILDLIRMVADRNPGNGRGPYEDAQGEPMQDDADAAISWIRAVRPGAAPVEVAATALAAPPLQKECTTCDGLGYLPKCFICDKVYEPITDDELLPELVDNSGPGAASQPVPERRLDDLQGEGAASEAVDKTRKVARAPAAPSAITWPKKRDVGRLHDMEAGGYLRVLFDSDGDVIVEVFDGKESSSSVEFCNPGGGGGGKSSNTRLALIALMVAMEADNAQLPSRDWWALRAGGNSAGDR